MDFHALTLQPLLPVGFAALYAIGSYVYQPEPLKKLPDGTMSKPIPSKFAPSRSLVLAHNILLAVFSLYTFVIGYRHMHDSFSSRSFWEAHCDLGGHRWEVRIALGCLGRHHDHSLILNCDFSRDFIVFG